ncbi:MAG: hypothetical protein IJ877_00635 [Candidatus Gastranaerophilales bacterium]|nr:hypothetical protein [Candidatus Gastranaerophilales bacterium]
MKSNQDKEKIIKDMQEVVYQMKIDDIEENPDSEFELFTCSSCAADKSLAGSILYGKYRLCNDCVLMYETACKLSKVKDIEDFIRHTEDLRLQNMCDFIKQDTQKENN